MPLPPTPVRLNIIAALTVTLTISWAGSLAWHVFQGEGLSDNIIGILKQAGVGAQVATWKDLVELKARMEEKIDIDRQIKESQDRIRELPGNPPDWFWHPWDYKWWVAKKAATEKIESELKELQNRKNELIKVTAGLAENPAKVLKVIKSINPLRTLWNGTIAPLLHLLLVVATLRYSLALVLRILLLNGFIHTTRL